MRVFDYGNQINKGISLVVTVLLAFVMVFCVGCSSGEGADKPAARVETSWSWEYCDDGTARITDCITSEAELTVPATMENVTVTAIGSGAFASNTTLRRVVIPTTVTSIDSQAFMGCIALEAINLENVTFIGEQAFSGCLVLNEFSLSSGLTTMGIKAFENCTGATRVSIPGTLSAVPQGAFMGCSRLEEVNLGEGVTALDAYAFAECISLAHPVLPSTLTTIGDYAFLGCHSLASVSLNNVSVGSFAYMDCLRLADLSLGDGVTSIGEYAFSGCVSMNSVRLPSSMTAIPEGMFMYCTGIGRIEIPKSVTSIERNAFSCCESLTIVAPVTSAGYRYALAYGFGHEEPAA